MRLRARVDKNQCEIVKTLRAAGLSVVHLHAVGKGVPDILVSNASDMWLVEIKMVKNKKGEPEDLTPAQKEFHQEWRGKPIIVGTTFDEIYNKIK